MQPSTSNRQLIEIPLGGQTVRGTLHLAASNSTTGVLFLNSLSLPRAASGDSAVYWAQNLAKLGLPVARIDLPGMGDSTGLSSTDLLDNINDGLFAQTVADLCDTIARQLHVERLILLGHCAGAVSALYGAQRTRLCAGLVLLDPYFHLAQMKRSQFRESLSAWARSSALGRNASDFYDKLKQWRLEGNGQALPANANHKLLAAWKQVSHTGLPILLVRAPGIKAQGGKARTGEFDYFEHIARIAGKRANLRQEFVEGAAHSFADRQGRAAVSALLAEWTPTALASAKSDKPIAQPAATRESAKHKINAVA